MFYERYKHTDFFAEGVTNLTGKSGDNRLQLLREDFSYFKEKKRRLSKEKIKLLAQRAKIDLTKMHKEVVANGPDLGQRFANKETGREDNNKEAVHQNANLEDFSVGIDEDEDPNKEIHSNAQNGQDEMTLHDEENNENIEPQNKTNHMDLTSLVEVTSIIEDSSKNHENEKENTGKEALKESDITEESCNEKTVDEEESTASCVHGKENSRPPRRSKRKSKKVY